MKNTNTISERDHQFLSAYLDGELSLKEKAYIDQLLAENASAQKTLQEIKKVKSILSLLPTRKVPRNFTLTVHQTRRFIIPSFASVLRYSTAVSIVLLVIVFALDLFTPFQTRSLIQSGADIAKSAAVESEMQMESEGLSPQMLEATPLLEREEIASEPKFSPDDVEPQIDSVTAEEFEKGRTDTETLRDSAPESWASPLRKLELVLVGITVLSALTAYLLRKSTE
jgi:hypothetical protein